MLGWNYSKVPTKRFCFKTLCVVLSVLLAVTMFHVQSIQVIRNKMLADMSANFAAFSAYVNATKSSTTSKEDVVNGLMASNPNSLEAQIESSSDVTYVDTEESSQTTQAMPEFNIGNVFSALLGIDKAYAEEYHGPGEFYVQEGDAKYSDDPDGEYWWSDGANSGSSKSDGTKVNVSYKGNGTKDYPFLVSTEKELRSALSRTDVNGGHPYITLTADIELKDTYIKSTKDETYSESASSLIFCKNLLDGDTYFKAILDGGDHQISCAYPLEHGLFRGLGDGAVIKNIKINTYVDYQIKNSTKNNADRYNTVGLLSDFSEGTVKLENITASGYIYTGDSDEDKNDKNYGGFIGSASGNLTFTKCTNKVELKCSSRGKHNCGGFVGKSSGNIIFEEGCESNGKVTTFSSNNNDIDKWLTMANSLLTLAIKTAWSAPLTYFGNKYFGASNKLSLKSLKKDAQKNAVANQGAVANKNTSSEMAQLTATVNEDGKLVVSKPDGYKGKLTDKQLKQINVKLGRYTDDLDADIADYDAKLQKYYDNYKHDEIFTSADPNDNKCRTDTKAGEAVAKLLKEKGDLESLRNKLDPTTLSQDPSKAADLYKQLLGNNDFLKGITGLSTMTGPMNEAGFKKISKYAKDLKAAIKGRSAIDHDAKDIIANMEKDGITFANLPVDPVTNKLDLSQISVDDLNKSLNTMFIFRMGTVVNYANNEKFNRNFLLDQTSKLLNGAIATFPYFGTFYGSVTIFDLRDGFSNDEHWWSTDTSKAWFSNGLWNSFTKFCGDIFSKDGLIESLKGGYFTWSGGMSSWWLTGNLGKGLTALQDLIDLASNWTNAYAKGFIDNKSSKVVSTALNAVSYDSKMRGNASKSSKGSIDDMIKNQLQAQLKDFTVDMKQEFIDNSVEYKDLVGVDFYDKLVNFDPDNANINSVYALYNYLYGQVFYDRIYAMIGEDTLLNNIYVTTDVRRDDKGNATIVWDENGQAVYDQYDVYNYASDIYTKQLNYLATIGGMIYNNGNIDDLGYPVASIYDVNNDIVADGKTLAQQEDFIQAYRECAAALQNNQGHEFTTKAYAKVGAVYCKYASRDSEIYKLATTGDPNNQDLGLKQLVQFSRLYRDAALDVYYTERNSETTYKSSETGKTVTLKGTPQFRSYINGAYRDSYEWSQTFLPYIAPKIYDKYVEKVNAYAEKNKIKISDEQRDQFFNTYVSNTREFEYDSYLMTLRSALYVDNPDIYTLDFLMSEAGINEGKDDLKDLLPVDSNKNIDLNWKYGNNIPGIAYPIYCGSVSEASYFRTEKDIENIWDAELQDDYDKEISEDKFEGRLSTCIEEDLINEEVGESDPAAAKNSITVGGGIQDMFSSLEKSLTACAQGLPNANNYQGGVCAGNHYDAAGGGYIGLQAQGNTTFQNCKSSSSIVGGTFAGGFIGELGDTDDGVTWQEMGGDDKYVNHRPSVKFESSYFQGSVSTADVFDRDAANKSHYKSQLQRTDGDLGFAVSCGGYIGVACNGEINIAKCNSSGVIGTRQFGGGIIGFNWESHVDIDGCGVLAGIAAPAACGGIIGYNHGQLKMVDSYVACSYDVDSNSDIKSTFDSDIAGLFGFFPPQKSDPNINISEAASQLCGKMKDGKDTVGTINARNIFYLNDGTRLNCIDLDASQMQRCYAVALADLQSGNVCYRLNGSVDYHENVNEDEMANLKFGQIINDFSQGSKQALPTAGSGVIVYKDLLKNGALAYTNFNPRKIMTHVIEFNRNNSEIGPDVAAVSIKDGESYQFAAEPHIGYEIESVTLRSENGEEKTLEPDSVGTQNTYTIKDIEEGYTVNINTVTRGAQRPEGSGRIGDPFLIENAEQLLWFNEQMRDYPNIYVQVKLMNDIDFTGYHWTPLFNEKTGGGFSGEFDGNGKKITGLNVPKSGNGIGAFFKGLEGHDVGHDWSFISAKNGKRVSQDPNNNNAITQFVLDSKAKDGSSVAITQKNIDDIIEDNTNVRVVVNTQSGDLSHAGNYIHNSYIKALLDNRIVDTYNDEAIVKDTTVVEAVEELQKQNDEENGNLTYIGFVDTENFSTDNMLQLKRLKTESGYVHDLELGGAFGDAALSFTAMNAKIVNVKNSGNVTSSDDNALAAGGIIAAACGKVDIINCKNTGAVSISSKIVNKTSKHNMGATAGGIVGMYVRPNVGEMLGSDFKSNNAKLSKGFELNILGCENTGYISATNSASNRDKDSYYDFAYAGGILGSICGDDSMGINVNLDGDINSGYVCDAGTTAAIVAGIVASVLDWGQNSKLVINNCINKGKIGYNKSDMMVNIVDAAGIFAVMSDGSANSTVDIYNSANYGKVWNGFGAPAGLTEDDISEAVDTVNIVLQSVMAVAAIALAVVAWKFPDLIKKINNKITPNSIKQGSALKQFIFGAVVQMGVSVIVSSLMTAALMITLDQLQRKADEINPHYSGAITSILRSAAGDGCVRVKNVLVTGDAICQNAQTVQERNTDAMVFGESNTSKYLKYSNVFYLDNGSKKVDNTSKLSDKLDAGQSKNLNFTDNDKFIIVSLDDITNGRVAYTMQKNAEICNTSISDFKDYEARLGQNIDVENVDKSVSPLPYTYDYINNIIPSGPKVYKVYEKHDWEQIIPTITNSNTILENSKDRCLFQEYRGEVEATFSSDDAEGYVDSHETFVVPTNEDASKNVVNFEFKAAGTKGYWLNSFTTNIENQDIEIPAYKNDGDVEKAEKTFKLKMKDVSVSGNTAKYKLYYALPGKDENGKEIDIDYPLNKKDTESNEYTTNLNGNTWKVNVKANLADEEEPLFENNVYKIANERQLKWFATRYNSCKGDLNKSSELKTADVLVTSTFKIPENKRFWTEPIGFDTKMQTNSRWNDWGYYGTFDGGNNQIINNSGVPLFGALVSSNGKTANIKNLKTEKVLTSGDSDKISIYAAIAYLSRDSVIDNVTVSGGLTKGSFDMVASFIAACDGGKTEIKNSENQLNMELKAGVAGGFIGIVYDSEILIQDCKNAGTIYSDQNGDIGGAIGRTDSSTTFANKKTIKVIDFVNEGSMSGNNCGGVIALPNSTQSGNFEFFGCRNEGSLFATTRAGGVFAMNNVRTEDGKHANNSRWQNIAIVGCTNNGDVNADKEDGGGLVGSINSDQCNVNVQDCVNFAITIKGGDAAGGLFGEVWDINQAVFINCASYTMNFEGKNCGGLIGRNEEDNGGIVSLNDAKNGYKSFSYKNEEFKYINLFFANAEDKNYNGKGSGKGGDLNNCKVDFSKFKTGEIAYNFAQNKVLPHSDVDYGIQLFEKYVPGQDIDFAGVTPKTKPSVGEHRVYKVKSVVDNSDFYSNYSLEDNPNESVCVVRATDTSDDNTLNESKKILAGEDYNQRITLKTDFSPAYGCKLNTLKVNGHSINVDVLASDYKYILDLALLKEDSNVAQTLLKNETDTYRWTFGYTTIEYELRADNPAEYDEENDRYILEDETQLWWFRKFVESGNPYANAILADDIDMGEYVWTPFGKNVQYGGTFDGDGYTIKGLTNGGDTSSNVSFIDDGFGATIKNLNLEVEFSGKETAGIFRNAAACYIDNVTVTGSITAATCSGDVRYRAAGFIANSCDKDAATGKSMFNPADQSITGNVIKNSIFSGDVHCRDDAGGFVSVLPQGCHLKIYNCRTEAGSAITAEDGEAGGILSEPWYASSATIENCVNNADVVGSRLSGGIVARVGIEKKAKNTNYLYIGGCVNNGKIGSTSRDAGGILGAIGEDNDGGGGSNSTVYIEFCVNNGEVESAEENAAGMIGCIKSFEKTGYAYINFCSNTGKITASSNNERGCGGMIGYVGGSKYTYITNSISVGDIHANTSYIGTVIGRVNSNKTNRDPFVANVRVKNNILCRDGNQTVHKSDEINIKGSGVSSYNDNQCHDGTMLIDLNNNKWMSEGSYIHQPGQYGAYGQIIDDLTLGPIQSYPVPNWDTSIDHRIYKLEVLPFDSKIPTGYNNYVYSNKKDLNARTNGFDGASVGVYFNNPYQTLTKADGKTQATDYVYEIFSQSSTGDLYRLPDRYSCLIADDWETRTAATKLYVTPCPGFEITGIKINGFTIAELRALEGAKGGNDSLSTITYNDIITSFTQKGKAPQSTTSFVEVSATHLPEPRVITAPTGDDKKGTWYAKYAVESYSDLLWVAAKINTLNTKAGSRLDVDVTKEIVMEEGNKLNDWYPIGNTDHPYRGVFTGSVNGTSCQNIRGIMGTGGTKALFGCVQDATIQDINVQDISFKGTRVAGLVGESKGVTIKNVNVDGTVHGDGGSNNYTAGIVGTITGGKNTIENCTADINCPDPKEKENKVGGIVARVSNLSQKGSKPNINSYSNVTDYFNAVNEYYNGSNKNVGDFLRITKCTNYSNLHSNKDGNGAIITAEKNDNYDYCGGIIGHSSMSDSLIDIINCENYGTIKGDTSAGIFANVQQGSNSSINIEHSYNFGSVSGDKMGGIVGCLENSGSKSSKLNVKWCKNYGYVGITAKKIWSAGGIIGEIWDKDASVEVLYSNNEGGVNGGNSDTTDTYSFNCKAGRTADITMATSVMGLVGAVIGCLAATGVGAIAAAVIGAAMALVNLIMGIVNRVREKRLNRWGETTYAGGIVGQIRTNNYLNLINCMNLGDVKVIKSDTVGDGASSASTRHWGKMNIFAPTNDDESNSHAWHGNAYAIAATESNANSQREHYRTWEQFASGEVAYYMQFRDAKDGYYSIVDQDANDSKNYKNIDSIKDIDKIDNNIKRIGTSDGQVVYFGQNIDKYDAEQTVMTSPGFDLASDEYKVYKHYVSYKDSNGNVTSQVVYSNYADDNSFRILKDFVSINGDEEWYTKEVNPDQPLAKMFDVSLMGGRSFEATIPNYDSQYSWGGFEKYYDVLNNETAVIKLDTSKLNADEKGKTMYSIDDLHLYVQEKQDWTDENNNTRNWWEPAQSDKDHEQIVDRYNTTQKDLFGGESIDVMLTEGKILGQNTKYYNNEDFVKNCFKLVSEEDNKTTKTRVYKLADGYDFCTVTYEDGAVKKVVNPQFTQIVVPQFDANGNLTQELEFSASLDSYDYALSLKTDGSAQIEICKPDINKTSFIDFLYATDVVTAVLYKNAKTAAAKENIEKQYKDQYVQYLDSIMHKTDDLNGRTYISKFNYFIDCDVANAKVHSHKIGNNAYETKFKMFDPSTCVVSGEEKDQLLAGSYYLAENLTLEKDLEISQSGITNICLNGHTIDLNGHQILATGFGQLNICDCNGSDLSYAYDNEGTIKEVSEFLARDASNGIVGGVIYNGDKDKANTSMFNFTLWSKLNIYGGTVYADSVSNVLSAPAIISDEHTNMVNELAAAKAQKDQYNSYINVVNEYDRLLDDFRCTLSIFSKLRYEDVDAFNNAVDALNTKLPNGDKLTKYDTSKSDARNYLFKMKARDDAEDLVRKYQNNVRTQDKYIDTLQKSIENDTAFYTDVEVYFNNKILGQPSEAVVNGNIKSLKYGKGYAFNNFNGQINVPDYKHTEGLDGYVNAKFNNVEISFDKPAEFEKPIYIDGDSKFVLTNGFDEQIKAELSYSKLFTVCDDSRFNIALEAKDGKTEVAYCAVEDIVPVYVSSDTENGKVTPVGEENKLYKNFNNLVKYVVGSTPTINYTATNGNLKELKLEQVELNNEGNVVNSENATNAITSLEEGTYAFKTKLANSVHSTDIALKNKETAKLNSISDDTVVADEPVISDPTDEPVAEEDINVVNKLVCTFNDYETEANEITTWLDINSPEDFNRMSVYNQDANYAYEEVLQDGVTLRNDLPFVRGYNAGTKCKDESITKWGYRLTKDIKLSSTWYPEFGKFVLDLNGHALTVETNTIAETQNAIYVNDPNTTVTVINSQMNSATPIKHVWQKRSFTLSDTGQAYDGYFLIGSIDANDPRYAEYKDGDTFDQFDANYDGKGSYICDSGAVIGGSIVTPYSYYLYEQRGGAVVVDDGVLTLSGVKVKNNTSTRIIGGAGATVNKYGKLFVAESAEISNNTVCGDTGYAENWAMFAGGIASRGYVHNSGTIKNNTSVYGAASAVFALNDRFVNDGVIANNVALRDKVSNKNIDSVGAVFVSNGATFENNGYIRDNTTDVNTAAVVVNGALEFGGRSMITGNTYNGKQYDIALNSSNAIEINSELTASTTDKTASYVSVKEAGKAVTHNWLNAASAISSYFKPYGQIGDNENIVFAYDNNNEVSTVSSADCVKISYTTVGDDFAKCSISSSDYYVEQGKLNVRIYPSANKTLKWYAFNNDVYYVKDGEDTSEIEVNKNTWSDKATNNLTLCFTDNVEPWTSGKTLPTDINRSYCLLDNVVLENNIDNQNTINKINKFDGLKIHLNNKYVGYDMNSVAVDGSNILPTVAGTYKLTDDFDLLKDFDGTRTTNANKLTGKVTVDLNGHEILSTNDSNIILNEKSGNLLTFIDTTDPEFDCDNYKKEILKSGLLKMNWQEGNALPSNPGSYSLTQNVVLDKAVDMTSLRQLVTLDLNGYTITSKDDSSRAIFDQTSLSNYQVYSNGQQVNFPENAKFTEINNNYAFDNIQGACILNDDIDVPGEYVDWTKNTGSTTINMNGHAIKYNNDQKIYFDTNKLKVNLIDTTNPSFDGAEYKALFNGQNNLNVLDNKVIEQEAKLFAAPGKYILAEDLEIDKSFDATNASNVVVDLNGHEAIQAEDNFDDHIYVDSNKIVFTDSSDKSFNDSEFKNEIVEKGGAFSIENPENIVASSNNANVEDGLPNAAGTYKLNNNVVLDETWYAPEGTTVIDLNGKTITTAKENMSLIIVNNENSNVRFVDSTVNSEAPVYNYLTKESDGTYSISSEKDASKTCIAVAGGIIGGAKFSANDNSGAIRVEKGSLVVESATIAANAIDNNDEGFFNVAAAKGNGAAAVTVESGASFKLGVNATISYNKAVSVEGTNNYAAAAVATKGSFENNGKVVNNTAESNAVAGVYVSDANASLVNNGVISNNTATNASVAGVYVAVIEATFANNGMINSNSADNNSVAAVRTDAKMSNSGSITMNKANDNDSVAGIESTAPVTLEESSQISDNVSVRTQMPQDILFVSTAANRDALLDLGENFKANADATVTYIETEGYNERAVAVAADDAQRIGEKAINAAIGTTDTNNALCLAKNGNMVIANKSEISTLHVVATEGGSVDKAGDTSVVQEDNASLAVNVAANEGYVVKSISVTTEEDSSYLEIPENCKEYTVAYDSAARYQGVKVAFEKETVVEAEAQGAEASQTEQILSEQVFKSWTETSVLPAEQGSYKLENDVTLATTWNVPEGSTQLDLNGHNITIASQEVIMNLANENVSLDIVDSVKDRVQKFNKAENGMFVLDENGTDEVNGAVIYGGHGTNGGAFTVGRGANLALHNVNVIGNTAENGGAAYTEGTLVIDENSVIKGNSAKVAGAVYATAEALFVCTANICDNIAFEKAGGIFAERLINGVCATTAYNNYIFYTDEVLTDGVFINDDIVLESNFEDSISEEAKAKDEESELVRNNEAISYISWRDGDDYTQARIFIAAPDADLDSKGVYLLSSLGTIKVENFDKEEKARIATQLNKE